MAALPLTFYNHYDSKIVLERSPAIVEACVAVAEQDEQFRKILLTLLTGSAYGQLALAVLMLAIPILANHGMLPPVAAVLVGADLPPVRDDDDDAGRDDNSDLGLGNVLQFS